MSGAHQVSWWGALDPYTFVVWCSSDKMFDLPDPAEADRLFSLSLMEPPGVQHRAYLDRLDSDKTRLLALTAFTVYAHEWRHWYDATSTPFGMWRTGQLAAFFATMANLDPALRRHDRIFVPLLRWASTPDLVRVVEPGLPELDPSTVEHLEKARRVLRKADHGLLARASIGSVTILSAQILEALAMLEQETAVEAAFGAPAAAQLRTSMKTTAGGRAYYAAVDLVESRVGKDRRNVTKVLEAALFGDYAGHGSLYAGTPPALLEWILERGTFGPDTDIEQHLDMLLLWYQGVDRRSAHDRAYTSIKTSLGQMARPTGGRRSRSHSETFRDALAQALSGAFLAGAGARHRDRFLAEGLDTERLLEPHPYSYRAPFVVEGFPGRLAPSALDEDLIVTLGGLEFASYQQADEVLNTLLTNQTGGAEAADGPYRLSVLWAPKPEPATAPQHFGLLDIFRDLMYWRGVLFGAGSMSPFTFRVTTQLEALERRQSLVGPGVPPVSFPGARHGPRARRPRQFRFWR